MPDATIPSITLMMAVNNKLPKYTSDFPLNKEWKNVRTIKTIATG
jgi:hypothetical protein